MDWELGHNFIVMDYIVMAYIVMAYVLMACMVVATEVFGARGLGVRPAAEDRHEAARGLPPIRPRRRAPRRAPLSILRKRANFFFRRQARPHGPWVTHSAHVGGV